MNGNSECLAIRTRASGQSAKRQFVDVNSCRDKTALDTRDLRSVVDRIRLVRRIIEKTVVDMITTYVMLLLAGIAIKFTFSAAARSRVPSRRSIQLHPPTRQGEP